MPRPKIPVEPTIKKGDMLMRNRYLLTIALLFMVTTLATQNHAKKPKCPAEYQRVPLGQVAAQLKDFAGCKVDIEGQFGGAMDQEMAKDYKTFIPTKYKDHLLFLV